MRAILLLTLLMLSGCALLEQSKWVSPSNAIYDNANKFYENKEFYVAIILYEEYLELKPRSELAVAAKLNLGMSHYYLGMENSNEKNFKQAHDILEELNIKDENIKKYVDKIIEICKTNIEDEIQVEEEEKAQLTTATDTADGSEIEITVLDAYLDNFGTVVLKGKTDKAATTVTVEGKYATLDENNIFTASVRWNKGDFIFITAKDESGSTGDLIYYPDGERPDKPESLRTINTTSNSVEIEWDENDEEDVKGYLLFYRRQGGSLKEVPDLIKDTKHEVIGFGSGSSNTIEFYLRAVDKMNNESEDSDILEVTIP